jgi:hypothetical protein
MTDYDPWVHGDKVSAPRNSNNSRIVAGIFALIMVPLSPLFGVYGALTALSLGLVLKFSISILFIVAAGLSVWHAFTGRHYKSWSTCIVAIVFISLLDAWVGHRRDIAFCEKYVIENCTRSSDGKIECPNTTFMCAEKLGEKGTGEKGAEGLKFHQSHKLD